MLITYQTITKLAETEKYALKSQMRDSAMSIPTNIVEGFYRRHVKDKIQFYRTSHASAGELKYQFQACKKLGYLRDVSEPLRLLRSIDFMLRSMIRKTPDLPTCL